ncbi:MAG: NAD(P)H-binding protein [Acidobacteriota bacterium]
MNFVITGSLGNIGRPLTKDLVEKGHAVTVISSNPEKKNEIESMGAAAAIGSLDDADFLASTLTGADGLFAMVPPDYTTGDSRGRYRKIGDSYAAAVKKSGINRVVQLSSIGADLDAGTGFILGSHDVEGILGAIPNIELTTLRPAYFYSNLFNFAGMIKAADMIGANYGGGDLMIMVHPRDIAAVVAEELGKPTGGGIRYIASDERSCDEIAKVLGEAIGKPDLKWVTFTDEQTQTGMEENGFSEHIAANFTELGASVHSGIIRKDYDLHKPETMGMVKLEDFAKEFAAAF